MKPAPFCLVLVALVLVSSSCQKKPRAETADEGGGAVREGTSVVQPAERTETGEIAPSPRTASGSREPRAALDPATANIPAELLGADQAYEAWFKKHQLDLSDPGMLDADPDGDGATNRDEFLADTNPRDPNSRPGVHAFMRLQEYREVKVPLMLEAIEGETARIKHVGEGEPRSETVRMGQTIGGMKVARMLVRKETDKNGDPVDLSRVELEDPVSNERVLLVKDMPAKSPSSHAILTSADRQTTVTVKQGDLFEWPQNPGTQYKVVDLREDQAVVQQVDTKKMFTIPRQ